jgi:hypothetical protein
MRLRLLTMRAGSLVLKCADRQSLPACSRAGGRWRRRGCPLSHLPCAPAVLFTLVSAIVFECVHKTN